jgi:hypothetical protein
MRRAHALISIGFWASTLVALATPAAAKPAPGPDASAFGWCSVLAYDDPDYQGHPEEGRFATTVTTPTPTGLALESSCGVFDFFTFGSGLAQTFSGRSRGFAMGSADPGVLRLYGEAVSEIDPSLYEVGVVGASPYRARTLLGASVAYADVFVPGPTSGAPNAGDATTLKPILRLDCVESGTYGFSTAIFINAYSPEAYAADLAPYDGFFIETAIPGGGHSACEIDTTDLPRLIGVTVGTPVVIAVGIGVDFDLGIATPDFPLLSAYSNALNTGTLELRDADGMVLTGQSGKVYGPPGVLPTITTSSTVSTTSTLPPTTTTLPGCAGTCGDGTVQPACAEACECPPTGDPIQAGYGCDGTAITPPQPECLTCRGCQVLSLRCFENPTTTVPWSSTTSTTTTTLPAACAGLGGASAARCLVDGFLAEPLCLDAPARSKIEKRLRRKLGGVVKILDRSLVAGDKKEARLLRKAVKKLAAVATRAEKKLSATCAGRVGSLVEAATSLIED